MTTPAESALTQCGCGISGCLPNDGSLPCALELGHPRCAAVKRLEGALVRAGYLPDNEVEQTLSERTLEAVRRYEEQEWLVSNKRSVHPCTWNALLGNEEFPPILHGDDIITLHPQPDEHTCWAACLASMLDLSIDKVRELTPQTALVAETLRNNSETHSWVTKALAKLVRSGPVMVNALGELSNYSDGFASKGHCFLITGVRGREEPDGKKLVLRFWDPWPVGQGAAYSKTYFDWLQECPLATFRNTIRGTSYASYELCGGTGGVAMKGHYPL